MYAPQVEDLCFVSIKALANLESSVPEVQLNRLRAAVHNAQQLHAQQATPPAIARPVTALVAIPPAEAPAQATAPEFPAMQEASLVGLRLLLCFGY